jgi:HPt (histidine-containing phosphotransfer) domain-containing protein
VAEILELFIETSPLLLNQIRKDIEGKNWKLFFKNTAKFKGSLGSLQMHSLMLLVDRLEVLVKGDDTIRIPAALSDLWKEHSLVVPLLRTELKGIRKTESAIKG